VGDATCVSGRFNELTRRCELNLCALGIERGELDLKASVSGGILRSNNWSPSYKIESISPQLPCLALIFVYIIIEASPKDVVLPFFISDGQTLGSLHLKGFRASRTLF
jgi:hypothetical protein